MTKVGTLKNKQFSAFEKEIRAVERMKRAMRGDKHYDAEGVPTKDRLLGLDKLRKFAHGRTKQRLTLDVLGKEKTYKKRTLKAYRRRLTNLIKRTVGGKTLKELIAGISRKISKSGDVAGTSRKQRVRTISSVQFVKMLGNIAYFKVSASGSSPGEPSYYQFQVQFNEWISARALHPGIRGVEKAIQDTVKIHCSCKDFQFTYGFVSYHGKYGIESEQSYPKIRNPKLENTMCKHGGRVSEALLKGEFGLKIALTNAMKAQAKDKENIDKILWAQPEKVKKTKVEEKLEREVAKKGKEISATDKARKKAEKTKEYKDFTKKEKDKLFKVLPKIVKKSLSSKAKPVEKIVKDYAKKEKIDPKKAVRFARSSIQDIMDKQLKAASKAVKSVKSKRVVTDAKIKGDLIKAEAYGEKFGDEVYQDMLKDISKESGKSVAVLKRMVK